MRRRPAETLQELAARLSKHASSSDFTSIADPQDEALPHRFISSVHDEAVLKALFKINDQ